MYKSCAQFAKGENRGRPVIVRVQTYVFSNFLHNLIILNMHKLKNEASRKGKDRRASSSTETTPVKQSKSRKLDTEEKDDVPLSLSSVYSSGEPDTNMEAEPAPMGHDRPRPLPNLNDEEAPRWFREFEKYQDHRFDSLLKECRDTHETLRFDMNTMKDTVEKLQKQLTEASDKMDELENRIVVIMWSSLTYQNVQKVLIVQPT